MPQSSPPHVNMDLEQCLHVSTPSGTTAGPRVNDVLVLLPELHIEDHDILRVTVPTSALQKEL